jgi:hypothetical protein
MAKGCIEESCPQHDSRKAEKERKDTATRYTLQRHACSDIFPPIRLHSLKAH